ncbi:hypothetical protein F5144DRAFT_544946 [Chaetomium tenue]|uniref:Uncharacterized protein n=1 Tax=Chaetomium tenue TaxID=1854479 RepID=A0ACB7PIJ1_9PEZI|nr:hypothetical protein F5144DRAFT_544946 [Chaetomium globosum]
MEAVPHQAGAGTRLSATGRSLAKSKTSFRSGVLAASCTCALGRHVPLVVTGGRKIRRGDWLTRLARLALHAPSVDGKRQEFASKASEFEISDFLIFSLNQRGEEANGGVFLLGPSLRNSKRRVEKARTRPRRCIAMRKVTVLPRAVTAQA